jgi:hypothetical protein
VDGRLQDLDQCGPVEVPAALHHAEPYALSGEHPGHEHGLAADEPQAVPAGYEPANDDLVHGKKRSSTIAQRQ